MPCCEQQSRDLLRMQGRPDVANACPKSARQAASALHRNQAIAIGDLSDMVTLT